MDALGKTVVLLRRLRAAGRRGRLDDDLAEEMREHVALRERALVEDGMDPRDAAFEARRMFGNITAIREETRDMWSFPGIESLAQDVRFGLRLLRRTPLVTATAVLCLATGIASAVAVFSVTDAVLFRTLDVPRPAELRAFRATLRLGGISKVLGGVDRAGFQRIQEAADSIDLAGFRPVSDVAVEAAGIALPPVVGELVTGNYFKVLGPPFLVGRPFTDADDADGPTPVVVTERLWRGSFDADPQIIGRPIRLNRHAATVVGVVRRFRGLTAERPADVFVPWRAAPAIDPAASANGLRLFARLHPGMPVNTAESRLAAPYRATRPELGREEQLQVELLDGSHGVPDGRASLERPLWLGLALVGVLLVVACANTAGLLLSRFVSRQHEFSVRAAIGAGRGRLARQLLIEAMLIASVAVAAGLYSGWLAAPLLIRAIPGQGELSGFELRFDWRLLAFTAAVAVAAAAGAGAASLVRLWRTQSAGIVSSSPRSVTDGSRRLSRMLMAAQVACSLLLVVGAVAMGRTVGNLRSVPPGFDVDRTFVVSVNATGLLADPAAAARYHAQVHERIAAAPGVASATMAQVGLLTESATTGTVDVPGFAVTSDEDRWTRMFFVGPDYFETIGMPLIRGRGLSAGDGDQRVAVVNERFARFYFGSADDAIGHAVNNGVRIVGVAGDARYNALREPPPRAMFVPYASLRRPLMAHIVRARGETAFAMTSVREAIAAHDARLRPTFATADELLLANIGRERFFATIAGVLSLFALLLACGGLYGAVAYGVSQRGAELAVRIALGATRRDILSLVLAEPLRTTLAGIAVGLPASWLVLRSASSLLFGVQPFDPAALLACAGALVAAAVAAAFWPARRASRIDPVAAFRSL